MESAIRKYSQGANPNRTRKPKNQKSQSNSLRQNQYQRLNQSNTGMLLNSIRYLCPICNSIIRDTTVRTWGLLCAIFWPNRRCDGRTDQSWASANGDQVFCRKCNFNEIRISV